MSTGRPSVPSQLRTLARPAIVALLTLATAWLLMAVYVPGELLGDFRKFFLPSNRFGVPAELRAHGITELYTLPGESGWDGQFYYYISNDILATKDTADIVDSDAYRYQRIGVPLIARAWAFVTGKSWVSPRRYYRTGLFLVTAAAFAFALFLERRGRNAWVALLWSVGFGTQVTILNGLPDGPADALVILAVIALLAGRNALYVALISVGVLAREAYVLVPGFVALGILANETVLARPRPELSFALLRGLVAKVWIHAVPMTIFLAWQIFLRVRFHRAPSSQANGILGAPFESAWRYARVGLSGSHPLVGAGQPALFEGVGVVIHVVLLAFGAFWVARWARSAWRTRGDRPTAPVELGIAAAFGTLLALYACFGDTVMMHHTGYMKASHFFVFVVPFAAAMTPVRISNATVAVLIVIVAYFDFGLWQRVSGPTPYWRLALPGHIEWADSPVPCLPDFHANVRVAGVEELRGGPFSFVRPERVVFVDVDLTNTSSAPFRPREGAGGVNLGYRWFSGDGRTVVGEGPRAYLADTLAPGETRRMRLTVTLPPERGRYVLRIGPVQELCAWFYEIEPTSAVDLPYRLR